MNHGAKISKREANYQEHPKVTQRCGGCSMFREGLCTLVAGRISASGWCKYWEKKG
jgi:hypothetical protein